MDQDNVKTAVEWKSLTAPAIQMCSLRCGLTVSSCDDDEINDGVLATMFFFGWRQMIVTFFQARSQHIHFICRPS